MGRIASAAERPLRGGWVRAVIVARSVGGRRSIGCNARSSVFARFRFDAFCRPHSSVFGGLQGHRFAGCSWPVAFGFALKALPEPSTAAAMDSSNDNHLVFHGTTILSVRRQTPQGVQVAIGGDGQVTLGNIVVKGTARKVRKLHHGKVLAGFAGATADAFTLFERFEAKLEKHQGHLVRAAIELTKDWRTDRVLRRLEAMLAVADSSASLIITGNGDVLEPENGIVAIGSGGAYAQAAGSALLNHAELSAAEMVNKCLEIAGEICIYTNMNHTIESL